MQFKELMVILDMFVLYSSLVISPQIPQKVPFLFLLNFGG